MVKDLNINNEIRAQEVRVISDEGQLGVMTLADAIAEAARAGLDLVEVAPAATPPVCRIMDYGKYRYQQNKKLQDARKSQTTITVKEIRVRPKTEEHDLQVKIKHIRKFLAQKDKVKVNMLFRGREISYTDIGRRIMEEILESLSDIGIVDQPPKLEGRNMIMVLSPKKIEGKKE